MKTFPAWLAIAALISSASCGLAMRPVRLDASRATWESLAGEWRGEYTMTGHDRRGLIAFRLNAAEQQAAGDVLMIPEHAAWPYEPMSHSDPRAPFQTERTSQLLTIRFVSADRGMLRGTMAPYWDPDRECQAWVSFLGSIDGNTIAGSFVSVCEDGVRTLNGRWKVERRRG